MTPITAEITEETPMVGPMNAEQDVHSEPIAVQAEAVNGHEPADSPTMAEAIAERELKAILEAMLFVSPNSRTLSRPSNTAVGTTTGSANLFGMFSSSYPTRRIVYDTISAESLLLRGSSS